MKRAYLASLWVICMGWNLAVANPQNSTTPASEAASTAATPGNAGTVVPRLVEFSGTITDSAGKPATGNVAATFSLYQLDEGGTPLWSETQTLALDSQGRYKVFLGAASADGLPLDLFSTGAARWLGVAPGLPGVGEQQPRVLLVGVPYALKAADADTLGGMPPSAFVTTGAAPGSLLRTASEADATATRGPGSSPARGQEAKRKAAVPNTAPYIQVPYWSETAVCCTPIYAPNGTTGNVGIGTSSPAATLNLNTGGTANQDTLLLGNATTKGLELADNGADLDLKSFGLPLFINYANSSPQNTYINGNGGMVGIGTISPSATLEVNGTTKVDGNLALPATTATTGAITLGGQPFLGDFGASSNTFVGLAGNLNSTNTGISETAVGNQALAKITTGINNTAVGSLALVADTAGSSNSAFGVTALVSNTTGTDNTADGFLALAVNTIGTFNTAVGTSALQLNSTGSFNTAVGYSAGVTGSFANTVGSNNTFIGYQAGTGTEAQLTNATAIGANAQVSENNALVLGANGVEVGIGTPTPGALLDIEGPAAAAGKAAVTALNVVGGTGGSSNADGTAGGQGASVTIQTGTGGANTGGGYGGAGGTLTLLAGAGGNSPGGGNGGNILIQGGKGGTQGMNDGGSITLQPGPAGSDGEFLGNPGVLLLSPNPLSPVGIGTSNPSTTAALDINQPSSGHSILLGQANNSNVFRVDYTGKGFFDGGTQTGGADFAESVAVQGQRSQYEPGDLLVIDATGKRRLALASTPYSAHVAGIYSTKPGVLATPHAMDDGRLREEVPLAVVGIVRCKVTAKNGPIHVGDLLVSSSLPGYAMKGTARARMLGAVVGKALEPWREGNGVIQVLVTLQ